jgi:hypothetical protein
MQADSRVHPVATLALLVACPLLSAAMLGAFAFGLATLVGAGHTLSIGAWIGAVVFVVNAAALCMAVGRGDGDERMFAFAPAEAPIAAPAHAHAS